MVNTPIKLKQVGKNININIDGKIITIVKKENVDLSKLIDQIHKYNMFFLETHKNKVFQIIEKIREVNENKKQVVEKRVERKLVEKKIKEVEKSLVKSKSYVDILETDYFKMTVDGLRLKGLPMDLPDTYINMCKDYLLKNKDIRPLVNFMYLLAYNPDVNVRTNIFDYLSRDSMILTPKGYLVAFRWCRVSNYNCINVDKQNKHKAITDAYINVKMRKKGVMNFTLFTLEGEYKHDWNHKVPADALVIGNVGQLYKDLIAQDKEEKTLYCSNFDKTFTMSVGDVVEMKRSETDPTNILCSNGLHFFRRDAIDSHDYAGNVLMLIIINPSDLVNVPDINANKARCRRYYFAAVIDRDTFNMIDENYNYSLFEDEFENVDMQTVMESIKEVDTSVSFGEGVSNNNMHDRLLRQLNEKRNSLIIKPFDKESKLTHLSETEKVDLLINRIKVINS